MTTPSRRTPSLGQACCNTLAAWLRTQIDPSITVYSRWADSSTKSPDAPQRTVTVLRFGRRQLEDILGMQEPASAVAIGTQQAGRNASVAYGMAVSYFMQPIQLHCRATTDIDLDDIVDEVDDAMNQGFNQTLLGQPGLAGDDPVRLGVTLALLESSQYVGNIDVQFDEVEQIYTSEMVEQDLYRAIFHGQARGAFQRRTQADQILQVTQQLTSKTT